MSDNLISRQAVMDALEQGFKDTTNGIDKLSPTYGLIKAMTGIYKCYIGKLPPIQPEIVRCKDCKHWIPYDWMFSEMWQSKNIADYPEDEIGCNLCDMAMKANDFCSRAERREVTT